jgi:glycosyltransferase involved in cell wall biosynthesis
MIKNIKVSVITPTWNRLNYLERVWRSLSEQKFKDFEWILADDGSTDGTIEMIQEIRNKSKFKIIIIKANIHIGKARIDNEAIKVAKGEFIVWNDSDDYFIPEAFQLLINKWEEIDYQNKENYSGILAYCKDKEKKILNTIENEIIKDVSLNEAREKYKLKGDLVHFTKTKLLKENLFPEVDLVIPEGVVWTKIGKLNVKIIKEPLMIKEYQAENCISFNQKMKYNRGMAYAKSMCRFNLKEYPLTLRQQFIETREALQKSSYRLT